MDENDENPFKDEDGDDYDKSGKNPFAWSESSDKTFALFHFSTAPN